MRKTIRSLMTTCLTVCALLTLFTLSAYAQASGTITLTLLHNNDGESQLFPNTNTIISSTSGLDADVDLMVGGISAFSTVMDNALADAQTAGNSTLSVYAGDSFLASSIVNCSLPPANNPIYDAAAQNLLPYDAHILGNHEFDFGPDFLLKYINGFTNQPFLTANLDFTQQAGLADLVVEGIINNPVDGTPIAETMIYTDPNTGEMFGIVGATTPSLPNISSPGDVIVETADITSTAAAVQTEVDELLAAGVNKIILVSHLQNINNDVELISMVTNVDIAVGGGGDELLGTAADALPGEVDPIVSDYPRIITDADGETVYLVTSKGGYSYLGALDVVFDANGMVTAVSGAPIRVIPEEGNTDAIAALGITDAVPGAADVDAVLTDVSSCVDSFATTQLAYAETTLNLARSFVRVEEANIGNLVADSFIYSYEQLGAQSGISSTNPVIALQNGGGIRQNAGDEIIGTITRQDTLNILPFGNDVTVLLDVPAEAVKAALEVAVAEVEFGAQGEFLQVGGLIFTYNTDNPVGSRVESVLLAGGDATLNPNGTITLPTGAPLVINGEVVAGAPLVNLVTNSFTAGGGDGYEMFEDYTQVELLENGTKITYERALTQYLLGDTERFPVTTQDGVDLPTILATDLAYQTGGEGRIIEVTPTAITLSNVNTSTIGTVVVLMSIVLLAAATTRMITTRD